MGFTPQQAQCIATLDRPLAVTAGAGSGKTFTLTQRIVGALESGYLSDIDELLAITYTEKAAGELKTRICRELRSHGLITQSLKAHNAYISTIHGMCSRILREHAIELQIDPAFSVLTGALQKQLFNQAVNEAFQQAQESQDKDVAAFLAEYPATTGGQGPTDLISAMGRALEKRACGMTLASIPQPLTRGQILNGLISEASAHLGLVEAQKESGSQVKAAASLTNAIEACQSYVQEGSFDALSSRDFLTLVDNFPTSGLAGFGTKDYKELGKQAHETFKMYKAEAALRVALPYGETLMKLSENAWNIYQDLKAQEGYLTNDDLLMLTFQAMEHHPDIAKSYQDRFKLVMVDEFQDTNQMQVDMISKLAGENGERLCVVGDAQQSIYRFQGADVSVYKRHLQATRDSEDGCVVQLPDNFRSHRDVLALVDAVFGQQEAFGSEFMHLDPKRDESRCDASYNQEPSRVLIQRAVKPKTEKGTTTETVQQTNARMLARTFYDLHQRGHRLGDMVILMGSTTHAQVYSQALRDLGMPCVVVKGSVFNRAPEVQTVIDLAYALANPLDGDHLYRALSSSLFNLSAQDLLVLSTRCDDEDAPHKQGLFQGLLTAAHDTQTCNNTDNGLLSLSCLHAASALVRAVDDARSLPLSEALLNLANDAGLLIRLHEQGAEGQAIAANVLKAIRILKDLEAKELHQGTALAMRFEEEVASLQEAPGALSAQGGDFVRIMTIHSSKGLEFPITAVAEFEMGRDHGGHLRLSEEGTTITFALTPEASTWKAEGVKKALGSDGYHPCATYTDEELQKALSTTDSASEALDALIGKERRADVAERLRLFYVALTRAKEMLVICLSSRETKDNPLGTLDGISALVESALSPAEGFSEMAGTYDFGGTKPAVLQTEFCAITSGDEETQTTPEADASPYAAAETIESAHETPEPDAGESEGPGFLTASPALRTPVTQAEYLPHSSQVTSYTGMSDYALSEEDETFHKPLAEMEGDPLSQEDCQFERKVASDPEKATDFGTAFHLLAQSMVEEREEGEDLTRPSAQRVQAICRRQGLSETQTQRIAAALTCWAESSLAKNMSSLSNLQAEVPFFMAMEDRDECEDQPAANAPWYLEGEIDLLGRGTFADPNDATAVTLVDYKTGGKNDLTDAELAAHHSLQAQCYASALLKAGFKTVHAHFVRVEHPDEVTGEPQVVSYLFTAEDAPVIERTLAKAHRETVVQ